MINMKRLAVVTTLSIYQKLYSADNNLLTILLSQICIVQYKWKLSLVNEPITVIIDK